jgi:hypothetical protein
MVCVELTKTAAARLLMGSVILGSLHAFSMHQHTDASTGLSHSGPNLQEIHDIAHRGSFGLRF